MENLNDKTTVTGTNEPKAETPKTPVAPKAPKVQKPKVEKVSAPKAETPTLTFADFVSQLQCLINPKALGMSSRQRAAYEALIASAKQAI